MSKELDQLTRKKIENVYNYLMERPLQVLEIFNNFFGEEQVDMQGYPSLEEFINWFSKTPIYQYTPVRVASTSMEDWYNYRYSCPNDLPIEAITIIVDKLVEYVSTIGKLTFNNIFILVHFPRVIVTNEHDRFVEINHLWAKIKISYSGAMIDSFTLNRSEYTIAHLISNYLHSHVSCIPKDNFEYFRSPCFGTGPIVETMDSLNVEYNEDIWNMFCLELSKYVTVESISGTPYHYLEKIRISNDDAGLDHFTALDSPTYHIYSLAKDKLKDFIRQFINTKKLKFNYNNGSYSIGMSFVEYIILISNEFISWYNKKFNENQVRNSFNQLKIRGVLIECIIDNGKIYTETAANNINEHLSYIGKKVCTFKGKDITVSITDASEIENVNKSVILNTQIASYILCIILKVLNYRYGKNSTTTEGNKIGTEVEYL